MAKIRILFYKAKWGDGHLMDNLINFWTWLISAKNRKVGPYSHVEIWTPWSMDTFHVKAADGTILDNVGTLWTSTMRGKDNGTVKRPASEVIQNPKRWDYAEIEVTHDDYDRMVLWMKIEVDFNSGYSMRDLFKFFGLGILADKKKNICSEFSNNAIHQAFGIDDDEVVSPRRLAWKLVQAGCVIKPLKEIEA